MKSFVLIYVVILTAIFIQCSEKRNQVHEMSNDRTKEVNRFEGFYFVAKHNGREAVYYYDAGKMTSRVFWSDKRDDVIELSYSPDKKTVFFLTARDHGKKGALPFVKKSKLFRLDPVSKKVEFLKETGSGIQIYTSWESDNNFRIVINSIDPVIATYINQNTLLLNSFGKTLKDEIKIFDLTSEGYPKLPVPEIELYSPGGRFSFVRSQKDTAMIQLRGNNGSFFPLIKTFQNINKIQWTENDSMLIFTTLELPEDIKTVNSGVAETSNLIIFSATDSSVVKIWGGDGLKRFLLFGEVLVFDDGFGNDSIIRIYDLVKRKTTDEIIIKGGCGLRNIPRLII